MTTPPRQDNEDADAYLARVVAAAPPLTPDVADRLWAMFPAPSASAPFAARPNASAASPT